MDLHPNTLWLMEWGDRMYKMYGHPDSGMDWCRKLAYFVGEEGNDYPSVGAIAVAERWEKTPPQED